MLNILHILWQRVLHLLDKGSIPNASGEIRTYWNSGSHLFIVLCRHHLILSECCVSSISQINKTYGLRLHNPSFCCPCILLPASRLTSIGMFS